MHTRWSAEQTEELAEAEKAAEAQATARRIKRLVSPLDCLKNLLTKKNRTSKVTRTKTVNENREGHKKASTTISIEDLARRVRVQFQSAYAATARLATQVKGVVNVAARAASVAVPSTAALVVVVPIAVVAVAPTAALVANAAAAVIAVAVSTAVPVVAMPVPVAQTAAADVFLDRPAYPTTSVLRFAL